MNLGKESEAIEHKRSTSELREGMESVASILNKHVCDALTSRPSIAPSNPPKTPRHPLPMSTTQPKLPQPA